MPTSSHSVYPPQSSASSSASPLQRHPSVSVSSMSTMRHIDHPPPPPFHDTLVDDPGHDHENHVHGVAATTADRKSSGIDWTGAAKTVVHHFQKHVGTGIICSVAYFDPGNWSVDLQAGSEFGYKLLFIVLIAGLMAVVFQIMATRLGCVTGLDLATHCRLLLYNRPKYTKLCRWGLLYPLYILSEVAIISTDLAELLGSATALNLLFPALPLWAGVLLTTSDVLLILAMGDPTRGKPVRLFELLIGVLVLAVFICLLVVIVRVSPDWSNAFDGFLPSNTIIAPGALYISVGIIGATVMPHALFLGSSLAKQDRVSINALAHQPHVGGHNKSDSSNSMLSIPTYTSSYRSPSSFRSPSTWLSTTWKWLKINFTLGRVEEDDLTRPDDDVGLAGWSNNSLGFIRAHLNHGIADVACSLLGFAVAINSLILILASAVFYDTPEGGDGPASLFQAFDLIKSFVGTAAAILFALGLLCAGQSASITATVAGQVVSEGFIRWSVPPLLRRLLTRLLGLIPSMLVAVIVGENGINTLLVLSQVILSIVLPFVVLPLVYLTSDPEIMRVKVPKQPTQKTRTMKRKDSDMSLVKKHSDMSLNGGLAVPVMTIGGIVPSSATIISRIDEEEIEVKMYDEDEVQVHARPIAVNISGGSKLHYYAKRAKNAAAAFRGGKGRVKLVDEEEWVDFSNGNIMMVLGYAIWLLITVANVYVIVGLGLGID